ncbi:transcriptional regulator MraZ [bacterium]|jgi:MraZ protein|nr:transcriptional regulator MraZ [bacterium]NBO36090.1 transcriptional regulator MraZ [bacterium]
MKMFLGEYQPNLTDGSRLALPKKLREQILGDEVVLSRGFEKCIFVYDKQDWLNESQKQIDNPITDSKTRDLRRYMFAGATDSKIDSQGRIVIPANLQSYATLQKGITVIGAGDHIEIWDTESWNQYFENVQNSLTA